MRTRDRWVCVIITGVSLGRALNLKTVSLFLASQQTQRVDNQKPSNEYKGFFFIVNDGVRGTAEVCSLNQQVPQFRNGRNSTSKVFGSTSIVSIRKRLRRPVNRKPWWATMTLTLGTAYHLYLAWLWHPLGKVQNQLLKIYPLLSDNCSTLFSIYFYRINFDRMDYMAIKAKYEALGRSTPWEQSEEKEFFESLEKNEFVLDKTWATVSLSADLFLW